MRSWPRSTERLLRVSARLLAGASLLTLVGVGAALRMSWQQAGQAFGPDGPVESNVPLDHRLTMVVLEHGYRQLGIQLLLAAVLVGAAVVALHRTPSWAQVRRVRWEVLGAGVLALALVVALVVGNLYVMSSPAASDGGMVAFIGPRSLTEPILGNLPPSSPRSSPSASRPCGGCASSRSLTGPTSPPTSRRTPLTRGPATISTRRLRRVLRTVHRFGRRQLSTRRTTWATAPRWATPGLVAGRLRPPR